tara:strand:+ start:302 stop:1120 length:819 start_codon:yes stop_codon:yes gene_type:complete
MILIFDTYGGLCNQMYDIHYSINFCIIHQIYFTFRYASYRNKENLSQWKNVEFSELFDDSFIETSFYIRFHTLSLNETNCHHYVDNIRAIEWLDKERVLLPQLDRIEMEHIVLRQFWAVCPSFQDEINFYEKIIPCSKLFGIFKTIKKKLPKKYNYIHYRYEDDFIEHFQITNHPKLCHLIYNTPFCQKKLKLYIACYEITHLPQKYIDKPIQQFKNVLYKKESHNELNFEEQAFIDFLIGKHAIELYGHSKSSFSWLLNSSKKTNNYYDIQ